MSRTIQLIALALAAAAVAAPMAQGRRIPTAVRPSTRWPSATSRDQGYSPGEIKVLVGQGDPLAVSYLREPGLLPQRGDPGDSGEAIDPLAVSYLQEKRASNQARSRSWSDQGDLAALSYVRNHGLPQAPTRSSARRPCRFQLVGRRHRRGRHARPRAAAGGRGRRTHDLPPEPPAARRQRRTQGRVGALPLVAETGPFAGSRSRHRRISVMPR